MVLFILKLSKSAIAYYFCSLQTLEIREGKLQGVHFLLSSFCFFSKVKEVSARFLQNLWEKNHTKPNPGSNQAKKHKQTKYFGEKYFSHYM